MSSTLPPEQGSPTVARTDALLIRPLKLAHIGLYVRDLARSVAFYNEVLGITVSDWVPGASELFMRLSSPFSTDHHVLALFKCDDPGDAADAESIRPGLAHFAFQLENFSALERAARFLTAHDLPYRAIQGGAGGHRRLYFHDPDGNTIELYCDMVQIPPDGSVPPIPEELPLTL